MTQSIRTSFKDTIAIARGRREMKRVKNYLLLVPLHAADFGVDLLVSWNQLSEFNGHKITK